MVLEIEVFSTKTTIDFVLKTINFMLKKNDFVLKTINFMLKKNDFAGRGFLFRWLYKNPDGNAP